MKANLLCLQKIKTKFSCFFVLFFHKATDFLFCWLQLETYSLQTQYKLTEGKDPLTHTTTPHHMHTHKHTYRHFSFFVWNLYWLPLQPNPNFTSHFYTARPKFKPSFSVFALGFMVKVDPDFWNLKRVGLLGPIWCHAATVAHWLVHWLGVGWGVGFTSYRWK